MGSAASTAGYEPLATVDHQDAQKLSRWNRRALHLGGADFDERQGVPVLLSDGRTIVRVVSPVVGPPMANDLLVFSRTDATHCNAVVADSYGCLFVVGALLGDLLCIETASHFGRPPPWATGPAKLRVGLYLLPEDRVFDTRAASWFLRPSVVLKSVAEILPPAPGNTWRPHRAWSWDDCRFCVLWRRAADPIEIAQEFALQSTAAGVAQAVTLISQRERLGPEPLMERWPFAAVAGRRPIDIDLPFLPGNYCGSCPVALTRADHTLQLDERLVVTMVGDDARDQTEYEILVLPLPPVKHVPDPVVLTLAPHPYRVAAFQVLTRDADYLVTAATRCDFYQVLEGPYTGHFRLRDIALVVCAVLLRERRLLSAAGPLEWDDECGAFVVYERWGPFRLSVRERPLPIELARELRATAARLIPA